MRELYKDFRGAIDRVYESGVYDFLCWLAVGLGAWKFAPVIIGFLEECYLFFH